MYGDLETSLLDEMVVLMPGVVGVLTPLLLTDGRGRGQGESVVSQLNCIHASMAYVPEVPSGSDVVLCESLSNSTLGVDAARVPRMASISSKKGHVFLPLPLTLLPSFTFKMQR